MNIETLRDYCLSKPRVTEGFPFDEVTLVFKVAGKMFALTGLEKTPPRINLKCDPEKSLDLQEAYEQIMPGFHMNKKHWITVEYTNLSDFFYELVDHSYKLVVGSFTEKLRIELRL
ncbi:MmcQ/YjbR family DNA-binding protein [Flavicella sp.]|uniref:MmcQ/YjbR family DNA-binding protein n=1 Tax=Flavicella sp. TaxID=2957742 RepID=UPI0030185D5C